MLTLRYHTEEGGLRTKVESRHNQTIIGELGFFLDEPRYAVRVVVWTDSFHRAQTIIAN